MSSILERVATQLESALGADALRREPDSSGSGSHFRAPVCSPANAEQVAAILRICAEAKVAVSPFGGGTAVNIGNVARQPCLGIELTRLHRIIEHDHANLTITAESGITLTALCDNLSAQKQFLPFDAPYPAKASLGGTVALNMNGPRRAYYGAVRDLVIGMKVALITGEQIKAGGKVVKNVAGYDMCKLFTGSLGTLGVITEATVRVAPAPETAATIIASGLFEPVMEFVDLLSHSQLLPAAVVLLNSHSQDPPGDWQVHAWCEGSPEHVIRHLRDGELMAQRLGLSTKILQDDSHRELWDYICDFPLETERCVYRVTLPRSTMADYLAALRAIAEPPQLISDLAAGTLWLSWPANDDFVRLFPQLTALAHEQHGYAVLFAAPSRLKEGIDVWGPPPASHSLMRKIKQQFDPDRLLNPGRFIGGI
jgi:glycolate oxidase FAD binding subunit